MFGTSKSGLQGWGGVIWKPALSDWGVEGFLSSKNERTTG